MDSGAAYKEAYRQRHAFTWLRTDRAGATRQLPPAIVPLWGHGMDLQSEVKHRIPGLEGRISLQPTSAS